MADFDLLATESTVQVLSPTVVHDVINATIRTSPSGVIASIPVDKSDFEGGTAHTLLGFYADNIELMMRQPGVIAGQGTQVIDPNGLTEDNVSFVVQYAPPGQAGTAITAEA